MTSKGWFLLKIFTHKKELKPKKKPKPRLFNLLSTLSIVSEPEQKTNLILIKYIKSLLQRTEKLEVNFKTI